MTKRSIAKVPNECEAFVWKKEWPAALDGDSVPRDSTQATTGAAGRGLSEASNLALGRSQGFKSGHDDAIVSPLSHLLHHRLTHQRVLPVALHALLTRQTNMPNPQIPLDKSANFGHHCRSLFGTCI